MQLHYGEEFRRKWQGFSPNEMAKVWVKRFEAAGIHRSVVERLVDEIVWEHPPTLPVIVDALDALQERLRREQQQNEAMLRLPAPSEVADPDSPVVQTALAELRRFVKARRMPA
jgi:hypothetical protein